MIHNYCAKWNSGVEDSNTIFAPLNLIRETEDGTYMFNYDSRNIVPANIFLYALLAVFPDSKSISFESMQELSLIFCLMNNDLLTIIKAAVTEYVGILVFSDVAGIKELQIKGEISTDKALENYYMDE